MERRKIHAVLFSGSLKRLISRSLSEADVLPSSPKDMHVSVSLTQQQQRSTQHSPSRKGEQIKICETTANQFAVVRVLVKGEGREGERWRQRQDNEDRLDDSL